MMILRKKRLVLITISIMLSLSIFAVKNNINNNIAIPTVSLPVSNKVIIIDAGHRPTRHRSTR